MALRAGAFTALPPDAYFRQLSVSKWQVAPLIGCCALSSGGLLLHLVLGEVAEVVQCTEATAPLHRETLLRTRFGEFSTCVVTQ